MTGVQTCALPISHTVTLGAGEYARGSNFSNTPLGSIHGQVFDDADGDSTRAPGETGLDSVRVDFIPANLPPASVWLMTRKRRSSRYRGDA